MHNKEGYDEYLGTYKEMLAVTGMDAAPPLHVIFEAGWLACQSDSLDFLDGVCMLGEGRNLNEPLTSVSEAVSKIANALEAYYKTYDDLVE